MERGRLRSILSLKTPTETFGINPCNRNCSATTTAAKFWSFTTPQQPYFAQRLPNPALLFHNSLISGRLFRIRFFPTTVSCRAAFLEFRTLFHNRSQTDSPESGFPPQQSLVGLPSLNSAPTTDLMLGDHSRMLFPPGPQGLLYAVTFGLQTSPSAATSLVGPLGRTPFSPPPLYLAMRIRRTQKRGRRNKCTGLFTKRDAVN